MIVIGELINGMYKNVAEAITARDKAAIQKIAKDQISAGAGMLDVNTGPYEKNPQDAMKWLVETIQEVSDATLVLDSTKPEVIEGGLKIAKKKAMINSTNSSDEKMDKYIPLAKQYKTFLIGLTMGKSGIPRDRYERTEHAVKLVTKCQEIGFDVNDLYLDPIVLPVNVAQAQGIELLESIREFKVLCDPAPKTVIGLSNASQGTKQRPLINRIYLTMAIANGLSAAIVDPLDEELMHAVATAELILNQNIYCDSFLDAHKK